MVSSPPKHSGLSGTAVTARQAIGNGRTANIDQESYVVLSDSDEPTAPTVAWRQAKAVDAREKGLARFRTILPGYGRVHEQPTRSASVTENETSRGHDGLFEKLGLEFAESEHAPSADSCVFPQLTWALSKDPPVLLPHASMQGNILRQE